MSQAKSGYLLDVNVLLALLSEDHIHHPIATAWFNHKDEPWALCALTEAGFLRNATAPRAGQIAMIEATAILAAVTWKPGYRYLPIDADFQTLCGPFAKKLYGTKQVTDAYLLGLAIRKGLVLVTMDKGVAHLAGEEYGGNVLLLTQ